MSDHDTLRWGDTQTITLAAAAGEGGSVQSKQMLNAKWQRPVVWRLMVVGQAQLSAGSTQTADLTILLNVGLGDANQQVPLAVFTFDATHLFFTLFFDIPAEAMQLTFQLGNLGNAANATDSVRVTAMAAPHAEPGAIAQMRDHMGADAHRVVDPDQRGLPRWMQSVPSEGGGPGFDDGELRYR